MFFLLIGQCRLGSHYLEWKIKWTWDLGLCHVHCWLSCNCDPCTTGVPYHFCPGNMEYGNSSRLVFTFICVHFSYSLIYVYYCLFLTDCIAMCYSFSALCGLSDCVGLHSGLPFCPKMWALECIGFHWHLFVDGFSFGKSFGLVMVLLIFFVVRPNMSNIVSKLSWMFQWLKMKKKEKKKNYFAFYLPEVSSC